MSLFKIAKTSQPVLSRCMSMLVNDPSYSWLADIGIKEVNEGVYNGTWGGRGNVISSISPINEQPIAQVIEVSNLVAVWVILDQTTCCQCTVVNSHRFKR